MNPGTLALLIPILAILGSFIVSIMKLRERQIRAASESDSHNESLHKEVNALRDRVEILERLVTDDSYDLKQKINNA
jgi:cell division protein FtsB